MAVTGVSCLVAWRGPGQWRLEFEVMDPAAALQLPEQRMPRRVDELWKTTCFELFLRRAGEAGYVEFNLSPSGEWAAYRFDGYRQGMADLDIAAAYIENPVRIDGVWRMRASLDSAVFEADLASLSAVIEEAGGTKSYWALAHASDKPDFHHPDSFVLELP
jgi:hypothetical protein